MRLHLWKNFTLDNELYQLIVENGATKILNLSYGRWDNTNLDHIWDIITPANDQSFSYNDQARLSGATANAANYGTLAWTYDANGNRLSETRNGTVNSYTYPPTSNRLSTIKHGATTTRAPALRLCSGRSSLEKPNRWLFVCCANRNSPYDAVGNTTQDLRGATAYSQGSDGGQTPC